MAAAISAMSDPIFIKRLIATVIYHATRMGLWSPASRALVLPGELTADELATMCIEKCIAGQRRWDRAACPSFYTFCSGQVRSILGNETRKARRALVDYVSPLPTIGEEGEPQRTHEPVTEPDAFFATLAARSGTELANRFLTDFALLLPDGSVEQRIIMLVLDDRDCATSSHCIARLGIPADQHEAALKRLLRRVADYRATWLEANSISAADWQEAS